MRVHFLSVADIYGQFGFIHVGDGFINSNHGSTYRANAAIFSAALPVFARCVDVRRAKWGEICTTDLAGRCRALSAGGPSPTPRLRRP